MGRYKENGDIFSEEHGNRMRGSKHRMEHRESGLNIKENYFDQYMGVSHWTRMSMEAVAYPYLEMFKT